jgi:hypothetical protein
MYQILCHDSLSRLWKSPHFTDDSDPYCAGADATAGVAGAAASRYREQTTSGLRRPVGARSLGLQVTG